MASDEKRNAVWSFVRENVLPVGGDRLSLAALILANLVPLFGALFLGWDAGAIVLLYWLENLVTGFYGILKIVFARMERPVEHLGKLFVVPFFCIHFGGFCAGHGLFLLFFFKIGGGGFDPGTPDAWPGPLVFIGLLVSVFRQLWIAAPDLFIWPFLALLVSHGVSFVQNFVLGGEYRETEPAKLMADPYKRIVVLHVAILAGGVFTMILGSPRPLLVVLILLKIGLDLHLHGKSHGEKKERAVKRQKRRRRTRKTKRKRRKDESGKDEA